MVPPREVRDVEAIDVSGIDVIRWNPPRLLTRRSIGRWLPSRGMTNNFGDMLGPAVASRLVGDIEAPHKRRRLLVVGSILHFAQDGDVIWGAGVNGKVPLEVITARQLDVRAVRGPLTAQVLRDRGLRVPDVFGDPGLLVPQLLGIEKSEKPLHRLTLLPNLRDSVSWKSQPDYCDPCADFVDVITRISNSQLVVTSSLHGLIIAESLGVPVALVRSSEEGTFKYDDYFEGTGRTLPPMHLTIDDALNGNSTKGLGDWDSKALLDAFPRDLWSTKGADEDV